MTDITNPDEVFDLIFYKNARAQGFESTIRQIFAEAWSKIPHQDKPKIVGNIEFIIFKPVIEQPIAHRSGGVTALSPSNQCLIIINSNFFLDYKNQTNETLEKETLVYFIAHELAHAYLNHPVEMDKFIKNIEKYACEQKALAKSTIEIENIEKWKNEEIKIRIEMDENRAYDQSYYWGFVPNQKDSQNWAAYNKWWDSRSAAE